MSGSRRDLLKMFGIGTVISPVVAGVALPDVQAKLIAPPKVELIGVGGVAPSIDLALVKSVRVVLETGSGESATLHYTFLDGRGKLRATDRISAEIAFSRVTGSSPMVADPVGKLFDFGMGEFLR